MAKGTARELLLQIAARRDGVVSVADAGDAGLSSRQLAHAARTLSWRRMHRGVYLTTGLRPTWHQRLRGACASLGGRVAVSHESAAALMRWDGFSSGQVDVTLETIGSRPLSGVRVHTTRSLPEPQTWKVDGLVVTTPARTLADLAETCAPERLICAVNGIARNHGTSRLESLREQLRQLTGRRLEIVLQILSDRIPRAAAPELPLEVETAAILKRAGYFPTPQFEIVLDGKLRRLDFAFEGPKVCIECDGFATHGGPDSFHADSERFIALRALGWDPIQVTNRNIADGGAKFLKAVQHALSRSVPADWSTGPSPKVQLELVALRAPPLPKAEEPPLAYAA